MNRWKLAPHWVAPSGFYREQPRYFPFRWLAILVGKWMMQDPIIHCFTVTGPGKSHFEPRFPDENATNPAFYAYCRSKIENNSKLT